MKIFPIFRWYLCWFNQPSRPKKRPLSGKPGAAATAACPRWQTLMGLGGKMLEGGIFHGGLIWFNGTIMGYKYIYIYIWLVVDLPLWKILHFIALYWWGSRAAQRPYHPQLKKRLVSWDDDSIPNIWQKKTCSRPPFRISLTSDFYGFYSCESPNTRTWPL